jgi:pimeloyl-ACP methyl ester carboxylesterase
MSRRLSLSKLAIVVVALALIQVACGGGGVGGSEGGDRGTTTARFALPRVAGGQGGLVAEPVFGGEAFVYQAGRQHPRTVVLIHGVGSLAGRIWDDMVVALARRYHVVVVDLPGFGRSSKQNRHYSPQSLSRFVRWVVKRTGHGKVSLVAHSLGGAVGLHYAATYPGTLRRLILVNVAGILHRKVLTQYLASLRPTSVWAQKAQTIFDKPLGAMQGLMSHTLGLFERRRLPSTLEGLLANQMFRKVALQSDANLIAGLSLMNTNFGPVLQRVRVPTAILWGDRDPIAPVRTGRVLAARLVRAHLVLIPGAGHSPMLDKKKTFERLLLQALVGTPPPPPPPPPPPAIRRGVCDGQRGMTFTGAYQSIHLRRCKQVRLVNVTATEVIIEDSEATVVNTHIRSTRTALRVKASHVSITASQLTAPVPLEAEGSNLDLAGVTLRGDKVAAVVKSNSTLMFSVCPVHIGRAAVRHLHGIEHTTVK